MTKRRWALLGAFIFLLLTCIAVLVLLWRQRMTTPEYLFQQRAGFTLPASAEVLAYATQDEDEETYLFMKVRLTQEDYRLYFSRFDEEVLENFLVQLQMEEAKESYKWWDLKAESISSTHTWIREGVKAKTLPVTCFFTQENEGSYLLYFIS